MGGKRRRRKVLANEDESALPPSAMRQRCGPIYICVPDTKGPQPCPKSVKTCPAGMKKVLKPGFGDVHIHADIVRGGRPRRSFGRGKRRRKVLANEDESALPEWAMRQRCGPIYICVPDKQNDSCPKSVKTCPAGMKRVLKSTLKNRSQRWQRRRGRGSKRRGRRGRGSKRRGRRGRKLLAEKKYILAPAVIPWVGGPPKKCPPVYICVPDKNSCPVQKPAKCGEGIKYKKEKYEFKGKQCERMVCDDDDTDPIKICPMPRCRQAPPGCKYIKDDKKKKNGCPRHPCGKLICKEGDHDDTLCPMPRCLPAKDGCQYVENDEKKKNGCPKHPCGKLVCKEEDDHEEEHEVDKCAVMHCTYGCANGKCKDKPEEEEQ